MSKRRNLGQLSERRKGPWWRSVLKWLVIVVVVAVVSITVAYYFDQLTESDKFCGLLCHSNRPEYFSQKVSDHADVECGVCHIGPGLLPKVTAKIYGIGELYMQLTNSYERPIELPVERMRPVEVVCGQCHWAQRPYGDNVQLIYDFAQDQDNSETLTSLVVRVGGGDVLSEREEGAHWHVSNEVWYIAKDKESQEIAWVGAMGDDGQLVEYRSADSSLTTAELEDLTRQEMNCMTCHNRATHDFRNPEDRLNEALAAGTIDSELPYVKREAMELLSASYPTQDAGIAAMDGLAEFYRSEVADVYAAKQEAIGQAVEALKEIYGQTTFPEMRLTWESYPNNLGHTDFPGCFRCHDGEHLNAEGEAIPSDCTLCHSVPAISAPGQQVGSAQLSGTLGAVEKPASHLEASFAWEHRFLASDACADCHGPIDYGTDNSSFCANGICHGQEWPQPEEQASFVHPVELIGQHAQVLCYECHQGVREPPFDDCSECHAPPVEPHYGPECSACHTPYDWGKSAAAWKAVVSTIPHRVDVGMDCLSCHGAGIAQAPPENHAGIPGETCINCHKQELAMAVAIPHTIEGASKCLVCHGEGKLAPVPSNHRGWSDDICLLCHQVAAEE